MDHLRGFIEEVVRSGGVCERDQVMNLSDQPRPG